MKVRATCNFCRWVQQRDAEGKLLGWLCSDCGATTELDNWSGRLESNQLDVLFPKQAAHL